LPGLGEHFLSGLNGIRRVRKELAHVRFTRKQPDSLSKYGSELQFAGDMLFIIGE
jgi:hypothetical protein